MSWRIVVISKRAKLDYKMGCMVVRNEDVTKIHLSEVSTVIIESTAVSLTAALLSELSKKKVKVIFCDEKRNPESELVSYYGSYDTSSKVRQQIAWSSEIKGHVWTEIITEKIRQQRDFLENIKRPEYEKLAGYIRDIKYNDSTNREGHAAKVYFNSLFGLEFSRADEIPINAALNYGYSIILSAVNREIVKNGYITQIGLFHDNIFNQYNLGSDLMEPFRILVDKRVFIMNPISFEKEEKLNLVNLLNEKVKIDGKNHYINNAIAIYVRSVFDALNEKDVSLIRFYKDELSIYESNSIL